MSAQIFPRNANAIFLASLFGLVMLIVGTIAAGIL
jgi:quinol:cytochrome c oxidoreductase pentaheme cytochrome subunit